MTAPAYQASPIKRIRATKAEVEARREALLDIIDDGKPMTVRQVFYQATVRGLVEKAESANPPDHPILFTRLPGTRTMRFNKLSLLMWMEPRMEGR